MAWDAAFAFDAFKHCAFFTANICTSAATNLDLTTAGQASGFQSLKLIGQDFQDGWVLITHVNVDNVCVGNPCANQHAFEETVRIPLKIMAVFECPWLALIAVDGHVAWPFFTTDEIPFHAGWKTSATQATQAAVL